MSNKGMAEAICDLGAKCIAEGGEKPALIIAGGVAIAVGGIGLGIGWGVAQAGSAVKRWVGDTPEDDTGIIIDNNDDDPKLT